MQTGKWLQFPSISPSAALDKVNRFLAWPLLAVYSWKRSGVSRRLLLHSAPNIFHLYSHQFAPIFTSRSQKAEAGEISQFECHLQQHKRGIALEIYDRCACCMHHRMEQTITKQPSPSQPMEPPNPDQHPIPKLLHLTN